MTISAPAAIKASLLAAGAADDLLAMAQACRVSDFSALMCAPELFLLFPTTSADALASVLVQVWSCELTAADLSAALQSCKQADGTAAYTPAQISAAVAASISLTVWDVAHIPTTYGGAVNHRLKMIGLCQGDLTTIKPAEAAQFLIISCLPGDYTPSAGSLIGAIQTAWGVNVGQMAVNPAADYRSDLHCWISQPFSALQPSKTVPYTQLICLESTGANAVAWIPGVFTAIQRYVPSPPPIPETGATIASALLSTGGAGADPVQVLTALFNGCQTLMTAGPGYNLTCLRIDVFNPALQGQLVAAFDQLKPAVSTAAAGI